MNVLYARKSSESEERQVLSIPAQVSELKSLAERRGERIDLVLEESRSAREPGRPVFGRLLDMIGKGQVSSVYAWRLDRLARNPVDGGVLIHHLGHGRVSCIVTPEGAFTGTGNDKLMMQIHFGMATKYVDDLSENVKRGNREVFKSGRITGRAPIGYIKAPGGTAFRGRGARAVIPDPERFASVAHLWKLMLSGTYTLSHIRVEAEAMGLRTRADRRHPAMALTISGLSSMFHNRFYCGEIACVDQTFKGSHTAMLTLEEFARVQAILGRQKERGKRWFRHFTYSGLLRCGACGRHMVGEEHVNRHGSHYTYYRCTRKKDGYVRCPEPYVSETVIHRAVGDLLSGLTVPPQTLAWLDAHIENWSNSELSEAKRRDETRSAQIARKEAAVRNLTNLVIHGDITDEEFRAQRADLMRELESLRSTGHAPADAVEEKQRGLRDALHLLPNLQRRFAEMESGQRRGLLAEVVDYVTVASKQATVHLRPNLDLLLHLAAQADQESVHEPSGPVACIEPSKNPLH